MSARFHTRVYLPDDEPIVKMVQEEDLTDLVTRFVAYCLDKKGIETLSLSVNSELTMLIRQV